MTIEKVLNLASDFKSGFPDACFWEKDCSTMRNALKEGRYRVKQWKNSPG